MILVSKTCGGNGSFRYNNFGYMPKKPEDGYAS